MKLNEVERDWKNLYTSQGRSTICSCHQLVIFPCFNCPSHNDNTILLFVFSIVKAHCKRFYNVLTFPYIFDKKLKQNTYNVFVSKDN